MSIYTPIGVMYDMYYVSYITLSPKASQRLLRVMNPKKSWFSAKKHGFPFVGWPTGSATSLNCRATLPTGEKP